MQTRGLCNAEVFYEAVTSACFLSRFSFRLLGPLIFCFLFLFVCLLFLTFVLIFLAFVSHWVSPFPTVYSHFNLRGQLFPHCNQVTATYSAEEWDLGIGIPSSLRPSRCISIALCIFLAACSFVLPVATHPGRSGEQAE
jgi:hypothetical protein